MGVVLISIAAQSSGGLKHSTHGTDLFSYRDRAMRESSGDNDTKGFSVVIERRSRVEPAPFDA
jgi:hypothetical protein